MKVRLWARRYIRNRPKLYATYKYIFDHRHYCLGANRRTQIVIEGFPRSGNSFAVVAFEQANRGPITIGHHWHSPSQFSCAANHGIPAVLLIRHPEDAVISFAIYLGTNNLKALLEEYVWFHQQVRPYMDSVLMISFEEVIGDFGRVIRKVNDRFGTNFQTFVHNEENVKKVFDEIETYQKGEHQFSRPSHDRKALKEKLKVLLCNERERQLLQKAICIYKDFMKCYSK